MSECYCDYGDAPSVYCATTHKARVRHSCYECGKSIIPGEKYERAAMLYEGMWDTNKTCVRCLDVRQYIMDHAPCFCWMHGSMLDDAKKVISEYGHVSAGFYIGAMKRVLRATRRLAAPAGGDRPPIERTSHERP